MIDSLVLGMIEKDLASLNLTEHRGLKDLLHYLEPTYKLPQRRTLTNALLKSNSKLKTHLKGETNKALFPSYAADMWKSISLSYFLSISIHWIDDCWVLRNVIASVDPFDGAHSGKNIADKVFYCLCFNLFANLKLYYD